MKYFVFRNNTVEPFFMGKDYAFSGYDDISWIPDEAENYVWFYQVPFKFDISKLAEEVEVFAEKLEMVATQLSPVKPLIVFTIVALVDVPITQNDFSLSSAITNFNSRAKALAANKPNVKLVDFFDFSRNYAVSELVDWKYYFISQMAFNPKLAGAFKKWWTRQLEGFALKRKKCLILDLDNTLWGGILGEDGINGIKIGGDYPGKAFLYFQEALLQLSKSGVILAVCSKNNEADVLEAWKKNPFILLKNESFSAWRINWQNKADNIKELAEELNIGLDSIVFVDDNPTERELVKQLLPMVEVSAFPEQPYLLPKLYADLVEKYFRVYAVTSEDLKKTEQYKANVERAKERNKFTDFSDYLRSLDIQLTLEALNDFNLSRIAQMTQKTNQFNLTTRRYTEADVRRMADKGMLIWCISVADRFGDNGITGTIFIDPVRKEIDTLLLSCRILGKGIEKAFVKTVLRLLTERGITNINATYIPTSKNAQVADFYDKCGFTLLEKDETGVKMYEIKNLHISDLTPQDYYKINIKR